MNELLYSAFFVTAGASPASMSTPVNYSAFYPTTVYAAPAVAAPRPFGPMQDGTKGTIVQPVNLTRRAGTIIETEPIRTYARQPYISRILVPTQYVIPTGVIETSNCQT